MHTFYTCNYSKFGADVAQFSVKLGIAVVWMWQSYQ
uniref:Uncharacterized protein n=1 Tax=Anguilla anguilla TaxID=7936 RepID=A0A0E9RGM7_ANGAN